MTCYKYTEVIWFCFFVGFIFRSNTCANEINYNHTKIFVKIGENITLKCSNNSIIKNSNMFWQMNHKELPGRAKIMKNGDLFISSFNTSDAGNYMCNFTAVNGNSGHAPLAEFELKPKSIPGSLLDVRVIPNTVLMLITWSKIDGDGGSPVLNITIRYRVIDDRISYDDWKVLQVNPSKIQKEIYLLHPNTHYKIQIWASNEIGDGAKTELNTRTLNNIMTEIELEKHLLEGIDTFDTRAWTFAVIVIMSTFSIFGIALCCLITKDPRMQKNLEDSDDIERIELIPNITINPGYCET